MEFPGSLVILPLPPAKDAILGRIPSEHLFWAEPRAGAEHRATRQLDGLGLVPLRLYKCIKELWFAFKSDFHVV